MKSSGLGLARALPHFQLRLLQAMAGTGVQLQAVKSLQLFDPFDRFLAERSLAVKGVENDSFQKVAQGQIVVLGKRFKYFEQALFNAHAGLHAFNRDLSVVGHGTNVPKYHRRRQGLRSLGTPTPDQ